MEPNPYQSPAIPPTSVQFEEPGDSYRVLIDIRDSQREMLALYREALARQKRAIRLMMGVVAILMVILVMAFGLLIVSNYIRATTPTPRRQSLPRDTAQ